MPFVENKNLFAPLALPEAFDLSPEPQDVETTFASVIGAAFRSENPIVSAMASAEPETEFPFDPSYRPYEDIQGTVYEAFADRFVGVRNKNETSILKARIKQEIEDDRTLAASGWGGFVAQMGAAILSPTSLLPGGAIVKGAKGVSIGRTGLSVAGLTGTAVALDEFALQSTQETRFGSESALNVGGSVILGGILGVAAGKMTNAEFKAASAQVETSFQVGYDVDRAIRSVNAAQNTTDLKLRREALFQKIRSVPVVGRAVTGSDPLMRTMLSDLTEVRKAVAQLAEPVLELDAAETGATALSGAVPVETRVKTRRNTELSALLGDFGRYYAEYDRDGPVGLVGRFAAPISGKWGHLAGRERKLSIREFSEEVAKSMRRGDDHPIPQVKALAEMIRKNFFDPIAREAEELGLFSNDIVPADRSSYLSRVYNTEKINSHYGDGTADDLVETLVREFTQKRDLAVKRLADDIEDIEVQRLAEKTDAEIRTEVDETVQAIKGLRPGESAWRVATAKPTRARVLDVDDGVLEPWLENDARAVIGRYFNQMVPELEIIRSFGDIEMTDAFRRINEEEASLLKMADRPTQRRRVAKDAEAARRDLTAMRDRIRGVYALPENPRSAWIVGGRVSRTLSYTGLLGGFMLSALPDLGTLVGRSGLETIYGAHAAISDPKRFGIALKNAGELGASAEWYLNGRAMEIASLADPFNSLTRTERMVSEIGKVFSFVSGIIPWNAGWKTVGGAFVSSRMSKAAMAVAEGKATKSQLRRLAANGIEPWMAERIAKQIAQHGDMNGKLWLPQGGKWTDKDAFFAFRYAMNREFDLMVITPNQDLPLSFSSEAGKFFFQFKSFAFTAHHRVLTAGVQRSDADTLASVSTMLLLGLLVSNLNADLKGKERKEGAALWEDAIDRSGLAGWFLEAHAPVNAITGGALSISGEEVSRFQAKATFEGFLGPSYGVGKGVFEGTSAGVQQALGNSQMTKGDINKLSRAVPGNNLWWFLRAAEQIKTGAGDLVDVER